MSDGRKVLAPRLEFNESALTNIIKTAINGVMEDLRTELRLKSEIGPNLAALYIPKFFNNSIAIAFSAATFPNDRLSKRDGFKRAGQSQQAACYAYGLDQCNVLGDPEECATHDPTPHGLAFVIEFEEAYIHLHTLESLPQAQAFPTLRNIYNNTLGEVSGLKAFSAEVYRQKLHDFIKNFVAEMPQVDRESIKAIVGMGGASPEAITELLEVAQIAVGNGAKVYNTIDPSVVAAHGAALYARDTVLDPKYKGFLRPDMEDRHDEL
ncbi:hypothetical protein P154DRAFT_572908 [Amniculicola lignicola CBS 123094]|uniref:Actin-like ATPase domain-containing protein n=1 Tax=Amniculicola lignicola CBS 123094 TaxID=1392246 RepID=A0A6A5WXA8_9PLEO|nr:hypothetical protein P154DRAFT_572908 [Amniculicola lignicola CBS 123094]